ncbi:MAG: hypothetical protein ABI639_16265 [Thermoanaerobaculia bacterium]
MKMKKSAAILTLLFAALSLPALAADESRIHVCNRQLCNGSRVISAPLPEAALGVIAFQISADGSRVAYLADQQHRTVFELFAVASSGGPVVRLNAPLPPFLPFSDYDVAPDFRFAGSRVAYRVVRIALGISDLWSVRETGGPAVRLSPPLLPGQHVERFEVLSDSYLRYEADLYSPGVLLWYVVPTDGNDATHEIFRDGFASGSTSLWR